MKKFFYTLCALVCMLTALGMGYGAYLNYVSEKNVFRQITSREILLEGVRPKYGKVQAVRTLFNLYLEPLKHIDVVARQSGTITKFLTEKYVMVKKGQVLAIMESKALEAKVAEVEASLAKTRTAMERAKISYERYGKLVSQGAVSGEKYDDAKAAYEGALLEVKALEAQREAVLISQEQLILKAPEDGYVDTFYYQESSYVKASTPVMLLLDSSRMLYVEEISEEDFHRLQPLPEKWTLYLNEAENKNFFAENTFNNAQIFAKGFEMHITHIEPALDKPADMRVITWSVDNDGDLLYAIHYKNAKMVAFNQHEGLIIPRAALNGTKNEVYVWGKKGQPEKRAVKTGSLMDKMIEITEGLRAEDIVILTDPALFKLKANLRFTMKELKDERQR